MSNNKNLAQSIYNHVTSGKDDVSENEVQTIFESYHDGDYDFVVQYAQDHGLVDESHLLQG
tara:strand:- start:30 stop:212 length:183 start_codon:yes stop_codon:yes gene_type:complete